MLEILRKYKNRLLDKLHLVVQKIREKVLNPFFIKILRWELLSKGADYLFLPAYLQLFSQNEYGAYTYTISVIVAAAAVIRLGVDTSIQKIYFEPGKYNRETMIFTANMVWGVFFLIFSIGAVVYKFDLHLVPKLLGISKEEYLYVRNFLFFLLLFNTVQVIFNSLFAVSGKLLLYQKYNFIRIITCNFIVLLYLHNVSANHSRSYDRLKIETVISIISFIPLYLVFLKSIRFQIDWRVVKVVLKIGLPLTGTVLVSILYNIGDKYIVQATGGFDSLATYNLALTLSLPPLLFFNAYQIMWFPKFMQLPDEHVMKDTNNVLKNLLFVFFLGFVVIFTSVISALHLSIIPGEYAQLIYIYPVIYVSKIFDSMTILYQNFIIRWEKTAHSFILSAITSFVALLLSYFFVPMYEISGAVWILLFVSNVRFFAHFFWVRYLNNKAI